LEPAIRSAQISWALRPQTNLDTRFR
jgi:hypothetical protein